MQVGVRIRPLNAAERKESLAWQASDHYTLRATEVNDKGVNTHPPLAYCYDRVFNQASTSAEVYDEAAKERVDSAMQGINSTLFVYG